MDTLGIDSSTSTTAWAFSENNEILDAGFIKTNKAGNNKQRGKMVIDFIKQHPLSNKIHHINLEAALSGFGGGLTSQQTIITLSRWNAILEYILSEELKVPVILCNVNTMRKSVLGAARIKGVKPKEYVKMKLPTLYPDIKRFEKLNRNGDWDAHNSDTYDAIICALFG